MAEDLSQITFYLSGGGSNTNPYASLGGAISSTSILSESATGLTMTGVTFVDAAGNAEGNGTLSLTISSGVKYLTWTPPGGTAGTARAITANSTYTLQGASSGGTIRLTIALASLPTTAVSNTLTIAYRMNQMFPDATADQATDGVSLYFSGYMKYTGATKAKSALLWMAENSPGEDTFEVALDPAGLGGTATTPTKSVTASSWAANVATYTVAAHGYKVDDYVTTAGITPSGYNQTGQITGVTTNTFTVALASNPGGVGTVFGTSVSNSSAPAGVVWTANPIDVASALSLGTLTTATPSYPIWIRRTIPAGVTTETLEDTFKLGYRAGIKP